MKHIILNMHLNIIFILYTSMGKYHDLKAIFWTTVFRYFFYIFHSHLRSSFAKRLMQWHYRTTQIEFWREMHGIIQRYKYKHLLPNLWYNRCRYEGDNMKRYFIYLYDDRNSLWLASSIVPSLITTILFLPIMF